MAAKTMLVQSRISSMTHRTVSAIARRRGQSIASLVRQQLVLIAEHAEIEDRTASKLEEIRDRLDTIEKALGGPINLRSLADSNGALLGLRR
jgi:hypothetical protein